MELISKRQVMNSTCKWRINVNINKYEICIFSKVKIREEQKQLKACTHTFQYSKAPKLLGVNLDGQLKIDDHIQQLQRKANNAIDVLRKIKGLNAISR